MKRAEGTGLVQPGEHVALGMPNSSLDSTYWEIVRKLEPGYSLFHKVGNKHMDLESKEDKVQSEYKDTL